MSTLRLPSPRKSNRTSSTHAASMDSVRYHMLAAANNRKPANRGRTGARSGSERPQEFLCLESKVIQTFHAGGAVHNQINISKYVRDAFPSCKDAILLRITDNMKTARLYLRALKPLETSEQYRVEDFECVQDVISARVPVVHTDDTSKQLTVLCQWKPLIGFIPDVLVAVPCLYESGEVGAIVALAFKGRLPKGIMDKKLNQVREVIDILVPYAFVGQGRTDGDDSIANINSVVQGLEKVEKLVGSQSVQIALTQIAMQIFALAKCRGLVAFTIDEADRLLRKFHSSFGTSGRPTCPDKKLHTLPDIPLSDKGVEILEWVANQKKGIRLANASDLQEHGINTKVLHSIGNCSCKSMLVVPVVDFSGESALLVELSDKDKVFNNKELASVLMFCHHAACILTCSVLVTTRDRNFRRRNIINEMLCSISFVKRDNVEQFIKHHRKNSNLYRGKFDEFNLCIRCVAEENVAGIALECFYDLNVLKEFKIRKVVLIRFIMSVMQGYGPLPYHNWYHAVSVAHFSYLLIKKLRLVEQGHLTKLEAFALVVSALTHDIDHRGTNNQFQSYTNSDIFKLYACEDSVMERHHLAIALAILHREDCNILESFNDADYKYFVELLTWNIIATDISKHMKNREALFKEARSGNPKQRKMARLSLFMTAADLCDNVKKWDENLPTVKSILTEFFNQGDMERQLGFTPIPMMDRTIADIPLIEFKFVKYIVCPVYRYLAEIYDELVPCLQNVLHFEDLWALATYVFDRNKKEDILEILEIPEMREDALMSLKGGKVNIEEVKGKRFAPPQPAPPPPPPPPSPGGGGGTGSSSGSSSEKPVENKPSVGEKSAPSFNEPELEEVDTGEKKRCTQFKISCLKCCRKRNK